MNCGHGVRLAMSERTAWCETPARNVAPTKPSSPAEMACQLKLRTGRVTVLQAAAYCAQRMVETLDHDAATGRQQPDQ